VRSDEFLEEVTKGLESYELDKAARPIFDFVDDFSTWYIRRSRDRFKLGGDDDKKNALATTRYVLEKVSKIIAPFTPFVAEEIWQELRKTDDALEMSVHLAKWPETENVDSKDKVIFIMERVREAVSVGLQLRAEAGMKVRQALASFTLPLKDIPNEYHQLIIDEMNVKELKDGEFALDTELTEELIAEGNMRDLLRQIQSLRKKAGLQAHNEIRLVVDTDEKGKELIEKFESEIKDPAGITEFIWKENNGTEIKIGDFVFVCEIEK
jgi:isoleucyl-tRNA synthetase